MKKLILFLALAVSLIAQKQVVKNSDGTVTLDGATISTIAPITMAADAGTLAVTNKYSSSTNGDNATLTPSAVGTAGQTISVKLINSDATNATTWTINNGGTDYTAQVPASNFVWWTLVSNGTDWIPTAGDPADGTAAATSLVHMRNPTSGVDFTEPLATVFGLDVAEMLGSHTTGNTAAGAITWTSAVYMVFVNSDAAAREYELPAAAGYAGKALIVYCADGSAANEIFIDPNASEVLVNQGTALAGGNKLEITNAANGNYVCLFCDGVRWITLGFSGTLADGGA